MAATKMSKRKKLTLLFFGGAAVFVAATVAISVSVTEAETVAIKKLNNALGSINANVLNIQNSISTSSTTVSDQKNSVTPIVDVYYATAGQVSATTTTIPSGLKIVASETEAYLYNGTTYYFKDLSFVAKQIVVNTANPSYPVQVVVEMTLSESSVTKTVTFTTPLMNGAFSSTDGQTAYQNTTAS